MNDIYAKKWNEAGGNFTSTSRNDTYDFISTKQHNFEGRRVFITGASRGIGRDTALSFARAGASKIAIGARTELTSLAAEVKTAAQEAGRSVPIVLTIQLDVTDASSVGAAAQKIQSEFGGLDILINNAGYLEKYGKVHETEWEEWWRTQEVNVKGPYLVTRAFLPVLLNTKDGMKTILNTASVGALLVSTGMSSYQMSKLSLLRLSDFVQEEYEDQGILCFSFHPGGVATELAGNVPDALKAMLTDTPQLAGDTVAWLTAERRGWLAARYVSANWDMKELLEKKDKIVEQDLLKVKLTIGT